MVTYKARYRTESIPVEDHSLPPRRLFCCFLCGRGGKKDAVESFLKVLISSSRGHPEYSLSPSKGPKSPCHNSADQFQRIWKIQQPSTEPDLLHSQQHNDKLFLYILSLFYFFRHWNAFFFIFWKGFLLIVSRKKPILIMLNNYAIFFQLSIISTEIRKKVLSWVCKLELV